MKKTHGMGHTRIYNIWLGMKKRCNNPDNKDYYRYGGRGIKVCKRWDKFENFYEDMKKGYNDTLTIDRIDNDKGYNKKNCRWATWTEQARNRRGSIFYKGECSVDATERLGGSRNLVSERIRNGWSKEKAFTTIPQKRRCPHPSI